MGEDALTGELELCCLEKGIVWMRHKLSALSGLRWFKPDRPAHRHSQWRHVALTLMLALAVGFSVAAILVSRFPGDVWLTQNLQRFGSPGFRTLMVAVSWPGYGYHQWLIVPGAAILLLLLRLRVEAVCLLVSVVIGWLLNNTIKLIIAKPRPAGDLVEIFLKHHSYSFPSGHVMSYVALYGFLFYLVYVLMPRSALRFLLLATLGTLIGLVGLSRIYLGAHWTSDVIGGYCFGFAWLLLVIHFYRRLRSGFKSRLGHSTH